MGFKVFIFGLLVAATIANSPVILLTAQDHNPLYNTPQLLQYLASNSNIIHLRLDAILSHDLSELKSFLRQAQLPAQRVSSFLASPQSLLELESKLQQSFQQQTVSFEKLNEVLRKSGKDLLVTIDPIRVGRRLQQAVVAGNTTATQVDSLIFDDISPYALSGLFVGLFLLVVLCIAVGCLMDLKTNDRFARQNLWVGRES